MHYFRKTLCRRCLRELWIYLRSWIYQRSEYGSGSEYGRVLKILEFWIYQGFKYVRVLERWQNCTAENFNIRKMKSTVKRMHGCKYFCRTSYSTSERTHSWNQLFLLSKHYCWQNYSNKWIASSPAKTNTVHFKEKINVILSVTKADTLCQRMDGCN